MPAELREYYDDRLQNGSAPPLPPRSIMPQHGNSQKASPAESSGGNGSVGSKITNDGRDGGGRVGAGETDGSFTTRFIKRYRVEVAASASSVLSTLSTFPLDSVKTRMQTYKYAGFLDCVQQTYQTEKLRGFFRGKWWFSIWFLDRLRPD